MPDIIKQSARVILWFEPLVLIAAIYTFWFPSNFVTNTDYDLPAEVNWVLAMVMLATIGRLLWTVWERWETGWIHGICMVVLLLSLGALLHFVDFTPPDGTELDRAHWAFLLVLFIPFCVARWVAYGRLWSYTPMDMWLIALLVLGVLNTLHAPYEARGIRMLMRPALGIWLMIYLTEQARLGRSMRVPFVVMIAVSIMIGWIALGATSWTTKSDLFTSITDSFTRIEFFAVGTFNPNEIGGVMAWLAPLMMGVALYFTTPKDTSSTPDDLTPPHRLRGGGWGVGLPWLLALIAFTLLILALFLGQSRSALIGVILALLGLALFATPTPRWRMIAVAGVIALTALQIGVFFNLFPTSSDSNSTGANTGVSTRDERTVGQRFDIWESAFAIVADYPLTGGGMNSFRWIRQLYPVRGFNMPHDATEYDPNYPQRTIPHVHNEVIQIMTDMGIPALLVFIGWHLTLLYMLWFAWHKGDRRTQIASYAIGAGLLAHAVYGMMDAIPLWDRFSFVYWLMVGLAVGQYVLMMTAGEVESKGRTNTIRPEDG